MKVFDRNFWLLVKPADDVPGQWVGHCLELDIISVGDSLQDAIKMTAEATFECVVDDLVNGRDPFDRNMAPAEYFGELSRVQSRGRFCPLSELPADARGLVAFQVRIRGQGHEDPQEEFLPPAWVMAKYNSERRVGAA